MRVRRLERVALGGARGQMMRVRRLKRAVLAQEGGARRMHVGETVSASNNRNSAPFASQA